MTVLYISRFGRGMYRARSNFYMADAEKTRITKIRRDVWMYATLDYTGGAIKTSTEQWCTSMRDKNRTGKKSFQNHTAYQWGYGNWMEINYKQVTLYKLIRKSWKNAEECVEIPPSLCEYLENNISWNVCKGRKWNSQDCQFHPYAAGGKLSWDVRWRRKSFCK